MKDEIDVTLLNDEQRWALLLRSINSVRSDVNHVDSAEKWFRLELRLAGVVLGALVGLLAFMGHQALKDIRENSNSTKWNRSQIELHIVRGHER